MIIYNTPAQETAKVLVIKTHIKSLADISKYRPKMDSAGLGGKDVLFVGLFDKPKKSIAVKELREAMSEIEELLKSLPNINVVVDDVNFRDSKDKLHRSHIFEKFFERSSKLWTQRGVLKENIGEVSGKFMAGFRADSLKRESVKKSVIDSEFDVDDNNVDFEVITTPDRAKEVFKKLHKNSDELYVDTETNSLRWENVGATILTFQVTSDKDPNKSCVFYYEHPKVEVSDKYKSIMGKGVKWLLESGKKVFIHNAGFDILFLKKLFDVDVYKVNMYDTMLIYHFLTNTYKDVPLSLKESAFKLGVAPDWDSKLDRWKKEYMSQHKLRKDQFTYDLFPLKDLNRYAALDTIALYHYWQKLKQMSKQHPAGDIIKITWEENWQSIMQSVQQMIFYGVPFKEEEAIAIKEKHEQNLERLQQKIKENQYIKMTEKKLQDEAFNKAMEKYRKKVEKAEAKGKEFKGARPNKEKGFYDGIDFNVTFNEGSLHHKRVLLFDVLKLKVSSKTETGAPAVGEAQLEEYYEQTEMDILRMFVEVSKVEKELSTYVYSWLEYAKNSYDGRLHSNFVPTATSGRLRSRSPNLLNVTKSEIKTAISPRDDDEIVVEADYSGLEANVMLLLHQDSLKLKMRESGVQDEHAVSAIIIAKAKNESPLNKFDESDPETLKRVKKEFKDKRQDGKALSFSQTYLGSWKSIMFTYGVDEKTAREIYNKHWEAYKGEREYILSQAKEAEEKGYFINFGNVPVITKGVTQDLEDKENMSNFRTVYNSRGQSSAFATLRAMDKAMRRFPKEGVYFRPFLSVYDSILYTCKKKDAIYIRKVLKEFMEEPIMENQLFPLEVDFEIGKSYKVDTDFDGTEQELQEVIDNYS